MSLPIMIKITEHEAKEYLINATESILLGIPEVVALPYIVMVKGYNEDFDNYSELNFDDLDNENIVDAGYEDYQLWLNDTLRNLVDKGEL